MSALNIPAGTSASLEILPPIADYPFVVLVAAPGVPATADAFFARLGVPGEVAAILTHDQGIDWPDVDGAMLLELTLEKGGVAFLGFLSLADAMAFRSKLQNRIGRRI
ncbi:hypothetical protein [Roseomonas chloroacetimidivorans]|uniref:hypothetical protein n=1 Tax=Roseomonas chloroacetimidivorans TaxID=1766656 RepID=UPI003C71144A